MSKKIQNANAIGQFKGDFVVGSIHKSTGVVSIADNPMTHTDIQKAKEEAARLAKQHTERKFIVFRIEAIASAETINWE